MNPLLNQEQLSAVEHVDSPMLVFSGAGSGKTHVVTFRLASLLKKGVSPASILGLTFTNKVAQATTDHSHRLTSKKLGFSFAVF